MGTITPPLWRLRLPLSVVTILIFTLAFVALLTTERVSSAAIFKFKSCSRRDHLGHKSSQPTTDENGPEDDVVSSHVDDRFDFDPNECSVTHGKWVFNSSFKPLYSDRTCPYVDRQFSCVRNGRPDSDYRRWEWQPDDCILPRLGRSEFMIKSDRTNCWVINSDAICYRHKRFNPKVALEKIRGKRLMFVGDSLQRNQWESFVCLVESIIPQDQQSMKRGRSHSVFKAKEYNATIEFYWAPFLIESNSDKKIIVDPNKRLLKVDSVSKHAKYWAGVDILAFNSYVWWLSSTTVRALWGSFPNGEDGWEELDRLVGYRIGLKTWANWIDSNVNPNKTRVLFTTMSPTHSRSADWGNEDGIKCFNETKPVMKKGHWGTGSNKPMMDVVADVVGKMTIPVTLINITQLSEYRIDGHASIYNELGGELLTEEQKADPLHYADCIHWCLPGVPDTWNQILLAYL